MKYLPNSPFPFTLLFFLIICGYPLISESAKILYVSFISVKSHYLLIKPLLVELAARGHQVTTLSSIQPNPTETHPNFREILTLDSESFINQNHPNYRQLNKSEATYSGFHVGNVIEYACELTYKLPILNELLQESPPFDLIIVPSMLNSCSAGYIYKFNTSLILFEMVTAFSWIPSPIGGIFDSYWGSISYWDRLTTFFTQSKFRILQEYYFKPRVEKLYRNAYNEPELPSVNQVFGNASLILSNMHLSIDIPRPHLPDVIQVLGIHCTPANKLPENLEKIVNSSPSGFLLFSMGSGLQSNTFSNQTIQTLFKVFSNRPETIIFKWDGEPLENIPKNIHLLKWFPQQDLLGHPKIKGFIQQGGFGSSVEAVYHGVPSVVIPITTEQILNAELWEKLGISLTINFNNITEINLSEAIEIITSDPKYKENAKFRSKLFRDRPKDVMDNTIYWIEYVIKYGGAQHLRSPARDLEFFQFHSLDVLGTVLIVALLGIGIIWRLILVGVKFLMSFCLPSNSSDSKRNKTRPIRSNIKSKKLK